MKNRIHQLSLAVIACGFSASAANATLIDYNGMGFKSSINYKLDGNSKSVNAGQLLIDFDGKDEIAYCVDLRHGIKSEWHATFKDVSYINGGKAAAFLFDTFAAAVDSNLKAAALQVAIWEVVEDFGSINLSSGAFKLLTTGSIATLAQSYLSVIPANLSNYNTDAYIIKSGSYPRSQHLIVPEPGTLIAILAGLPLVFRRRRELAA